MERVAKGISLMIRKPLDYIKNCVVKFQYYRDGVLYYQVCGGPDIFSFPVPINELGTATCMRNEKAIVYMCWIYKHIKMLNEEDENGKWHEGEFVRMRFK